ncbi:MAG TPA: magnesium/cobalt transporter CorA [Pirellulales bacterium]|jgi:magnesium transporter|nr:magnesium/cobalt transporter CorA [Pirellulales bacterium]
MNHKLNRHKRSKRPRQDRAAPCVSPGTTQPAYDGPPADIRVMAYGPSGAIEQHPADLDAIPGLLAGHPVVWVSVIGLDDAATICRVGKLFGIHPLALEDVVGYHEHPKSEPYGDHLLVIARVVRMDQELESDQFSMIVGRGFVVTFEQRPSALFEPLRQRIRSDQNGVLAAGPGYLAYSLLDYLIDGYFPVVEALGDRLEDLEDEALERPGTSCMQRIHTAKRDLRALRRAVWPLRDTLNLLARETSQWFDDDARMHLRDCFDHTARVIELTEMYRELGADLTELYLSSQSNRMNEVMRVLTIIATLFMPLSFITGVYGMNFNPGASKWNMPELNWRYGYPAVLAVLWVIAFSMLAFFYRKGWLKSFAPMSPPLDGPDAGHS